MEDLYIPPRATPRVHADFASMDILSSYNRGTFLMGPGRQIDAYLQGTTRINTDDNVWLEHRIPQDLYSGSTRNLFFDLDRFFGKNRDDALQALLPGVDVNRMQHELARLSRNGHRAFQLAAAARERQDREAEIHYLWEAYRDFNSRFYYPAGLRLAEGLARSGRAQEAHAVLHQLQFYYPAFAEAFQQEARLRLAAPQNNGEALKEVVTWGLRYNPDDETLQKLHRRIFGDAHSNKGQG